MMLKILWEVGIFLNDSLSCNIKNIFCGVFFRKAIGLSQRKKVLNLQENMDVFFWNAVQKPE